MYNNSSGKFIAAGATLPLTGTITSPIISYIGYGLVLIAILTALILRFKRNY